MSILSQLSSQVGDRTEASNLEVVAQCLKDPGLLSVIATGLKDKDAALVGDCAEVFTKVAEQHPDWIAPHAEALSELLLHKNTRVRWEAMHALSLVASLVSAFISSLVPLLVDKMRTDTSVIVRDYATDTLANYASTGKLAAECVYPYLKEMLTLWDGKQAGHALQGLANVARLVPELHAELNLIAKAYTLSDRAVVRKSAKALLNSLMIL